jgi:uncharacterized phiE125 gp8 family phage protein
MTDSIVTVEPTVEPISVADVVEHLRLDPDEAPSGSPTEAWILRNISAARKSAESSCRSAFVTQTRKFALDEFPRPDMNVASANWYGPQWGTNPGPLSVARVDGATGYEIYIPRPPLQSIVSVTYYDQDNTLQTLDPSQYLVDTYSKPARLLPAPDTVWPATKARPNAVEITFRCGYGDAAVNVPEGIRNWMLMRVGAAYENREEIVVGSRLVSIDLPFVDALLDEFRVVRY